MQIIRHPFSDYIGGIYLLYIITANEKSRTMNNDNSYDKNILLIFQRDGVRDED